MRKSLSAKLVSTAIAVLVGAAIYVSMLPVSQALIGPSICIYYKDATYKKVVGSCSNGCCGEHSCSGTVTPYARCERVYCTDVLCPN
jgi:hypothetical protein